MSTLSKNLRAIAASAILTLGAGMLPDASAGVFQVTPSSNGLGGPPGFFTADAIDGTSSTRIVNTSGFNYTAAGYIQYGNFALNSVNVLPLTSGLGVNYSLYGTFTQNFSCSSLLSPGVTCNATSVDYKLFADSPASSPTFTAATIASDPTVIGGGAIQLGSAALLTTAGTAGLNILGGAFENINLNFDLTPAGSAFFTFPIPFYNMEFNAFNNTSTGIACDTGPSCVGTTIVAINAEAGISTFSASVPEPASLALLGIGMLGLILFRRKDEARVGSPV